jgi:hypothetical protein
MVEGVGVKATANARTQRSAKGGGRDAADRGGLGVGVG